MQISVMDTLHRGCYTSSGMLSVQVPLLFFRVPPLADWQFVTAKLSVEVLFSHIGLQPLAGRKVLIARHDFPFFFFQSCTQVHQESNTLFVEF